MLNTIRVSFKDSLVYGLGNIAVKIIGFILIPLYTNPKYFTLDDFGVIALFEITGLVLISLMASGLPQSLMRWYWDKEHADNQKGIFFMSLMTQLVVSLLLCLFMFPFTRQLSTVIFRNADWSNILKLVILSSALQAINNIINTLMRLQSRSVLYTVTNLAKLLIVLFLTIYLIVFRGMGVTGIYLAQVAGNFLLILFVSGYTIKNCTVFFKKSIFRSMSKYGIPILLANFSTTALTVIDRYSLNSLTLLKYVAIYALAYKISSALKLVIVESIKMAVMPLAMKKINSTDNKRFYSKILLYSSYVLMLGIISISLFSFEIIKFMTGTEEYWSSFYVVPLLTLSIFIINMREISSYGLIIAKKTRMLGFNVIVACILNILLNILLIPRWNIMGAALTAVITQFIYWYLNYYFSQKEYYIPFELRKITILFLTGGLIAFSGFLMTDMPFFPRFIIKTGLIAGFPFLLYLFNFYEHVELQAIRSFAVKWMNIKNLRKNLLSLKNFKDT